MEDDFVPQEKVEDEEEFINVLELCNGFSQPSCMCYDADPDGWSIWSAVVDEDDAASGFSSALQIEWYDANGTTFFCDTHNNRIMSIQGDDRAYVYSGGEVGHYDGSVFEAQFASPNGVALETCGAVLVADTANHCVRRIYTGWVETIAGMPKNSGDQDGFGENALFTSPCGIAYDDTDGSIYVADTGNSKIKKVTIEGVVETVAGNGKHRLVDGPGIEASFNRPYSMLYWRKRLLVVDTGNHALREIDLSTMRVRTLVGTGQPGFTEDIEKFQFSFPNGICIRENNAEVGEALLWISDSKNSCVHQITINDDIITQEDVVMLKRRRKSSIFMNSRRGSELSTNRQSKVGDGGDGGGDLSRRNSVSQPSSPEVERRNSAQLRRNSMLRRDSMASVSIKPFQVETKTKIVNIFTLLGGEDEDDEMMRHGNKDGVFEVATMEHPMGLAFNTMKQELLCSDYYNNNIRKLRFNVGTPVPLSLIVLPEGEDDQKEVKSTTSATAGGADSIDTPNSPMSPLSPPAKSLSSPPNKATHDRNENSVGGSDDDGLSVSSSLSSGTGLY